MKKTLLIPLVVAAFAYAGTIFTSDTTGATPSASTDGVELQGMKACRVSLRVADSGTIGGGTLKPYYYDSNLGWVQGDSALNLSVESGHATDNVQVWPDLEVSNNLFGRLAYVASSITGTDGGTPNGVGVDGGTNVEPRVRIDCWGW